MAPEQKNAEADHSTRLVLDVPLGVSQLVPAHMPSKSSVQVAPPSTTLDANGLLQAFRRRWMLAIGLGVIGASIAAALTWYLLPPTKYIAEALLLVETEQPRLITQTKEYRSDAETDRRTQVALIKSYVLSKVLSQAEVLQLEVLKRNLDPAGWLERELKAEFSGKILRVALTSENANDATIIIKAVTATYLNEVANKEKQERIERNQTLQKHYDELEHQLESKRNRLRLLSTSVGSKDKQALSSQQRLAINRQSLAEEDLLRTQSDLKRATTELQVLRERKHRSMVTEPVSTPEAVDEITVEQLVYSDPRVQKVSQNEEDLKNALAKNRKKVRIAGDPSTVMLQSDLTKVQKQKKSLIEAVRSELTAPVGGGVNERQNVESNLSTLESEIEIMTRLQSKLSEEVNKYTDSTRKLDAEAIQIDSIHDEIKSAEEMAKLIGSELEALKIELKAPDRVRVIKEAKAPAVLDSTRQKKMSLMAGGGALGAIVLLVSFLEFRAQRIGSLDEVACGLGMKVVGTVPAMPERTANALPAGRSGKDQLLEHQLIESVDATRIMLTHAARAGSYRVVLVTSAVGGEGKTSVSSHLATSLARSGQRTLLIDGDLRRPMVHRLFDQPAGPGLCELLRSESSCVDVIRTIALNNLWIITAGKYDDHALSILSQPRSRDLFRELREQFDFIVVDSAPVLPVADTLLLGQHVDAALFSILWNVSQLTTTHIAHQRIAALGVPILGAVVSGGRPSKHYRYYGGASFTS